MQTVTQPSRTFQAQGKLHNVTSEAGNFMVAFYKHILINTLSKI